MTYPVLFGEIFNIKKISPIFYVTFLFDYSPIGSLIGNL